MKLHNHINDLCSALEHTDAFFAFLRSWWDGATLDAALWWQDGTGFRRRIIKTGFSTVPVPPVSDRQLEIAPSEFFRIRDKVAELGFMTFPEQREATVISHCNDRFGFKEKPGHPARWLDIPGRGRQTRQRTNSPD